MEGLGSAIPGPEDRHGCGRVTSSYRDAGRAVSLSLRHEASLATTLENCPPPLKGSIAGYSRL
eukprot:2691550-Rhodomonas_salina.1